MRSTSTSNIVADLDGLIDEPGWSSHEKDVFKAIKDCVLASRPIPRDLQDQYVRAIANNQAQDRYGK